MFRILFSFHHLFFLLVLALPAGLGASVVSVTGDLNDSFFTNHPNSLALGGPLQNTNEFYALCESEFLTLAADLTTGEATVGTTYTDANKPPNQTISSGTTINSTMIHYDPDPKGKVSGTITFPTKILGIIWKTGDLDSTDALLGFPGAAQPGAGRGTLENRNDSIEVVDAYTLNIHFASSANFTDQLRVITEPFHCNPVPEPGPAGAVLAIGMSLLFRRRR